ncbi:lamin-like protein [Zingiber officinale]|uniref:Phytocyanin domain-containing protein n=1 Tax=Zingiber officinale TaxID=94328 RepID=A0A8J5E8U6_ZINOF|nr:lamin-like protein [Zingiber officinale]KAG6467220.1 hypothetical protein ZIOFF_074968 [Zingiber officinale]
MAGKLLPRFLLFLSLTRLASPDKFTVGDSQAWNYNVNYTDWVDKHKPFHVGDWLVFYYQSGMADVIQVDEAAYNKCDASNPISNYSKGRSYAFQLNHTGPYYFICSRGFCYGGMRLAIVAEPLPPPSSPPTSQHLSAGPRSSHAGAYPLLSVAVVATSFLFLP